MVVEFVGEDSGLGALTDAMGSNLASLAVVAGVAAGAIAFVGDETARLDTIAKGFSKSGLTVVSFQELSHVATLAGTDIGNLSKATIKLTKNLQEVSRGAGEPVRQALEDIGLELKDLAKLSDTERLGVLGDALNDVTREADRAALAQIILGKSGSDLLPLFSAGSEGIDKAVASVGQIFTREQLAKAEAYQDSLAEWDKVMSDAAGTLAVALAPAFGDIADSMTDAGKQASEHLPVVVTWLESIAEGLGPPLRIMGFFGRQLAAIGRVADVVGGAIGRVTDNIGDLADDAGSFVSESVVGDWARDAVEGVNGLTDSAGGLTDTIADQIPISKELARSWDEVSRAITGAESASQEFAGIKLVQDGIGKLLGLAQDVTDEREAAAELTEQSIKGTDAEALATERLAAIMRASGDTQANVNLLLRDALVLRQQAAVLANDDVKASEAAHKIALIDAASTVKKTGGKGPSAAERVRAAGAAEIQDLEHMADLRSAIAVTAQEAFEAEQAAREAKLAGLELEQQALDVTRARGAVAKAILEAERDAVDQQAGLIVLEGRIAAREREAEATQELVELEQARNEARAVEGAQVIELDAFRLESQARQLEAEGQFTAAFGLRLELRAREGELLAAEFEAREAEIAARPPETELERIQVLGDLRQLEHDRELARIEQDGAARQAHDGELDRLAKVEQARKRKALAQAQAVAGASNAILSQGLAFASRALDARGVDGEKRERIDMKVAGVQALATGALEFVHMAAAIAALNPVQAVAHGAAGAFAVATGVSLIAGQLPSAGAAGAAAATPAPQQTETSEAPTVPGSTPAADREALPRTGDEAGGGARVVVQIENFNPVGDFSPEMVEQLANDLANDALTRGAA